MCAVQWVLLKSCIFGLCISVTEAGVVLATFDGKNTYSIGSEVELVCSITPYNNEMTWFVNNDPYADCIVGTCNPYSNKPYAFSFTFNETAGVFKLAIGSVTYSHADLSFACDDGIERKQISFNVTAVTNEGNGDHDLSTLSSGAIAGIVIGCVVFFCIIILTIVLHCRIQFIEKEENIRDWMEHEGTFIILMLKTIEVLSAMIVHQKTKLRQKIEKEIQKLQKIKEEEVTNKAKREQLLRKEQELIKKSNWTEEQVDIIIIRNTYGDEEQKRDIKTLHGLIKDEDNEGKCVFSRFIMQVLQEDKAAYDNIKLDIQTFNNQLKKQMMTK